MELSCNINPKNNTDLPTSLLQLLSHTLVLYQTAPYLPTSSLLALGATSKAFQTLIHNTPNVFRRLDLTKVRSAQFEIVAAIDHGGEVWRNVQLDENVTEDDFYGGPLLGIFNTLRRQNLLKDVQTLILDGLSVTSDLISDIITRDDFSVRILSIREVSNLNERKLQQALIYALRPSRPTHKPTIQGIYFFGAKDAPQSRRRPVSQYHSGVEPIDTTLSGGGFMYSHGAQIGAHWNSKSTDALAEQIVRGGDKWYQKSGKVIVRSPSEDWANILLNCEGIISFDAVLCKGPRHSPSTPDEHPKADSLPWYYRSDHHLPPRVATYAVGGCASCGTSPEGCSKFGVSPMKHFPLLAPPPLHSSTAKAAKTPFEDSDGKLMVRCRDCLLGRYCESCYKWWCEDCYQIPNIIHGAPPTPPWEALGGSISGHSEKQIKRGVIRSCFECGPNCAECIKETQLLCRVCGGGYCTVHNEGSTLTTCDWCARSGRRTRELY